MVGGIGVEVDVESLGCLEFLVDVIFYWVGNIIFIIVLFVMFFFFLGKGVMKYLNNIYWVYLW